VCKTVLSGGQPNSDSSLSQEPLFYFSSSRHSALVCLFRSVLISTHFYLPLTLGGCKIKNPSWLLRHSKGILISPKVACLPRGAAILLLIWTSDWGWRAFLIRQVILQSSFDLKRTLAKRKSEWHFCTFVYWFFGMTNNRFKLSQSLTSLSSQIIFNHYKWRDLYILVRMLVFLFNPLNF